MKYIIALPGALIEYESIEAATQAIRERHPSLEKKTFTIYEVKPVKEVVPLLLDPAEKHE